MEKSDIFYFIWCIKQNVTFPSHFVIFNNNPISPRYFRVKSYSFRVNGQSWLRVKLGSIADAFTEYNKSLCTQVFWIIIIYVLGGKKLVVFRFVFDRRQFNRIFLLHFVVCVHASVVSSSVRLFGRPERFVENDILNETRLPSCSIIRVVVVVFAGDGHVIITTHVLL